MSKEDGERYVALVDRMKRIALEGEPERTKMRIAAGFWVGIELAKETGELGPGDVVELFMSVLQSATSGKIQLMQIQLNGPDEDEAAQDYKN